MQPSPSPRLRAAAQATIQALIQADVRAGGWWVMGVGLMQGFAPTPFSPLNGLLLIGCGGAAFYFSGLPMFWVYLVLLLWAAVSNLWAPNPFLLILAGLEFFLLARIAGTLAEHYQENAKATTSGDELPATIFPEEAQDNPREARFFPWLGLIASGVGLGSGLVLRFSPALNAFWPALPGRLPFFFMQVLGQLGAVGLALSVAMVFTTSRHRALTVIGTLVGGAATMFWGIWVLVTR